MRRTLKDTLTRTRSYPAGAGVLSGSITPSRDRSSHALVSSALTTGGIANIEANIANVRIKAKTFFHFHLQTSFRLNFLNSFPLLVCDFIVQHL